MATRSDRLVPASSGVSRMMTRFCTSSPDLGSEHLFPVSGVMTNCSESGGMSSNSDGRPPRQQTITAAVNTTAQAATNVQAVFFTARVSFRVKRSKSALGSILNVRP